MPRMAHHRADNRVGPHHSWLRKKTYHLTKLFRHVMASWRVLQSMRVVSVGIYAIQPSLVSEWRSTLEDAMPYARDTEGTVWE